MGAVISGELEGPKFSLGGTTQAVLVQLPLPTQLVDIQRGK